MSKTKPFEESSVEYDNWYVENQFIYLSELNAIKSLIPQKKKGIEIGIGTGRFALPLGIEVGVEPSRMMADIARERGIHVLEGVAEQLPVKSDTFDYALMVTADCFFDDVQAAFKEAYRILKNDGFLIVAFIDKESNLGQYYEKYKRGNKFYKDATFHSVSEVTGFLKQAGFRSFDYNQTVYGTENIMYDVKNGYGSGGFVVVKAAK